MLSSSPPEHWTQRWTLKWIQGFHTKKKEFKWWHHLVSGYACENCGGGQRRRREWGEEGDVCEGVVGACVRLQRLGREELQNVMSKTIWWLWWCKYLMPFFKACGFAYFLRFFSLHRVAMTPATLPRTTKRIQKWIKLRGFFLVVAQKSYQLRCYYTKKTARMLDMRDLGMEVRGGSRQVRWKAWGQPSQQISSPPSLHTAHSSSLAWACTQRCWSSVDQQQLESSVDALSTPSVAGSPLWLKVFSTALKALLVSSDRSQEWNIPSTFRQRLTVPVKKKKKKKGIWWPDVNSLSTFGGGGRQNTETRQLSSHRSQTPVWYRSSHWLQVWLVA